MDDIKPGSVASRIVKTDDNVMLEITIEGHGEEYGFTLQKFDGQTKTWLAEVVTRIVRDIHEESFNSGVAVVRKHLNTALGINPERKS